MFLKGDKYVLRISIAPNYGGYSFFLSQNFMGVKSKEPVTLKSLGHNWGIETLDMKQHLI